MGHERLKQLRIGVIGAGNMGTTILEGLLDAGAADPSQLMASDPREARRKELTDRGVKTTASNLEVARFAQLLVLATKPQVFDRMLAEIAPGTGPETLVVSIAAGIPIDAIETQLAPGTRVIRTMPNTPALVGAGATAIAPGAHVSDEDLATVEALFASVGITEVLDESLMDAVTGLSGSGPAFIFVIIDALSDAGVKVGLHRSTAQRLAAQTVLGAAKMLIETGEHPGQLKDMVASPGGTTIAGLHTLEAGGLRKTLMDAVENATLRSKQLGEELAKRRGG
ncbi:MAG: pyrroline-5-carboxylate reductase [Sandaracinus sp.]|nr:pyrroline-5-carboxylate reductase [Sandaracinus sp.]MCB9636828.1 pyrroline-5-carboxylate reductase [Sandaracinus sp.]